MAYFADLRIWPPAVRPWSGRPSSRPPQPFQRRLRDAHPALQQGYQVGRVDPQHLGHPPGRGPVRGQRRGEHLVRLAAPRPNAEPPRVRNGRRRSYRDLGHISDPPGTENAIKGTPASTVRRSRWTRASIVSPGTGRSSRRYSVPSSNRAGTAPSARQRSRSIAALSSAGGGALQLGMLVLTVSLLERRSRRREQAAGRRSSIQVRGVVVGERLGTVPYRGAPGAVRGRAVLRAAPAVAGLYGPAQVPAHSYRPAPSRRGETGERGGSLRPALSGTGRLRTGRGVVSER